MRNMRPSGSRGARAPREPASPVEVLEPQPGAAALRSRREIAPPPLRLSARPAALAVGYLRRSTDRQEQSIPDQRKAVEAYCEQHGLTLLRCYTDDAISGTSTVGRR